MGAKPPKRDAWPLPKRVRHVWVDPSHPTRMPYQGLVLEWRQVGGIWTALVVYLDDQSTNRRRTVLRWVRAEHLRPVASNPNAMGWRQRRWRI